MSETREERAKILGGAIFGAAVLDTSPQDAEEIANELITQQEQSHRVWRGIEKKVKAIVESPE